MPRASRRWSRVLPAGDLAGDAVPAEAALHKLGLAVGAAQHPPRRRRSGTAPGFGPGRPRPYPCPRSCGRSLLRWRRPGGGRPPPGGPAPGAPAGAWGSRSRAGPGLWAITGIAQPSTWGGGAVILHQAQGLQLGEALAELFEAAAVRAPEAVDGLVRVADDEQALPLLAPPADKLQLQGVAVLELIDEQVGEAPPLAGGEVLLHGPEQQVVEVHSAPLGQGGLVGLVELWGQGAGLGGGAVFSPGTPGAETPRGPCPGPRPGGRPPPGPGLPPG